MMEYLAVVFTTCLILSVLSKPKECNIFHYPPYLLLKLNICFNINDYICLQIILACNATAQGMLHSFCFNHVIKNHLYIRQQCINLKNFEYISYVIIYNI